MSLSKQLEENGHFIIASNIKIKSIISTENRQITKNRAGIGCLPTEPKLYIYFVNYLSATVRHKEHTIK